MHLIVNSGAVLQDLLVEADVRVRGLRGGRARVGLRRALRQLAAAARPGRGARGLGARPLLLLLYRRQQSRAVARVAAVLEIDSSNMKFILPLSSKTFIVNTN